MLRGMRSLWAAGLILSLTAGSAALIAQPVWADGGMQVGDHGQSQDNGSGDGPSSDVQTSQTTSDTSSGTAQPGDHGDGPSFDDSVAAAVYAAHEQGDSGTILAEAVHQVLLTEHPNAKGLTVADDVYAQTQSTGQGGSPFGDVQQDAPWAATAVDSLEQAGVVNGTSSTTFGPNSPVTLGELATMLSRLQAGTAASTAGAPAGTPSWAQNGMAWAQEDGLLGGEQGLGGPDTPLTRAQAVLMLINAAGLGQTSAMDAGAPIHLQGALPAWAHGALALAIQLGLLQGSGGQLLADQPLTRAQMAVLLARLAVLEAQSAG